ncbi:MCE-family protein MCE3A [Mycolicibacter heraklionensis]|uniref:MCE-family protein MCE3A n=1 Tax=Mycolicibacter heraklionensis TaxID=512402 RepID=A0ABR5FK67_9MYCO|nr:MCE family protein [Mycolicibacter heraklionensis]KLO31375.1 MCE-family protein MCE3A [Mycolicibacter heraklionensis]
MTTRSRRLRIPPAWWTAILVVAVGAFVWLCSASFAGTLKSSVPVTLTSQRAGLVMESGAKVKMRGVPVGRVAGVEGGSETVHVKLELFPDQVKYIPANSQAEIRATTVFGAKYVDLIYPENPSAQHITAGAVLRSRNVSTEVNTVFENLVGVLHQIDPPKLNASLAAVAEAVRGRGNQIGEATTATNHVLAAVNPRMGAVRDDWRALAGAGNAYGTAAQHILSLLDAASVTSATVSGQAGDLNTLLLNTIGFTQSGIDVIGPNRDNLVRSVTALEPTTDLLATYDPEYTCLLQGAKWTLDNGGYEQAGGGDGATIVIDDAFLFGDDPYRFPDNLPIVAAKGGPGGRPGCGSLPDPSKNWPVRQLVTNTGWGTGLDIRPNPGIGFPGWVDYLPVTRGVPEPPSIRNLGPPAIGPVPYPGAPPYGAPVPSPASMPPAAPGAQP